VQTVVPPGSTDRYIAPTNQNYMNALGQLQVGIDGVANLPQMDDAAAVPTQATAAQAKLTTRQMAQAFRIDAEGLHSNVQKLLEDPIVYAEGLLRSVAPAELNGKGRTLCAQFRPIMAKYPFNPASQIDATMVDVVSLFKPKEGLLWQFWEQNLQKLLPRQGSQFVPNPTGGIQLNPAFVGFMNRAAVFSDAAFPGGAATPNLSFGVKPVTSADIESVRLAINGQTAMFGASATPAKPFTWPGASQGVNLTVKFKGGREYDYPSFDGLWAVFKWVAEADTRTGSIIELILGAGRPKRPVINPTTGQPVTVRFDISANPPVFDKGYFAGLTCVAEVAR
jgi:type VI protein secretion system component VasK